MKKERDRRPYVALHKEVIFSCPEWASLSPHAKSLYLLLKAKRNPVKHDGEVRLSYREIRKLGYSGLKRPAAVVRAFQELTMSGWIRRKDEGGGLFGKATVYILTARFDKYGF